MSENQEPKPEQPSIDELKKLAAEPGQINIGEGLKLDVASIKHGLIKNHFCQGMLALFAATRDMMKLEYRPENPSPTPNRPHCFACAMDHQFQTFLEGMALAFAITSVTGHVTPGDRRRMIHAFGKLFDEACAIVEDIEVSGGPGKSPHRTKA